ncbi:Uncharacterized protein FKW44_023980 [Caligus rogercresseyi]|uniref:BMERB domain-containing protein n=1 Tax=Caligus rogercresseyi TaxID=217165 RepID=A0A7T8GQM3_CALRO|nr:Uncharacterized protein FKW44_023980 [Caligus rogercresseyi]
MQLNIKEKESVINGRLESLRERLRGFEEISESLKTEEMRNEEAALIEELVSTVNEKNELVHHLANEEKAIDEMRGSKACWRNKSFTCVREGS